MKGKKYIINIISILAPIVVFIIGVVAFYTQSIDKKLLFIEWLMAMWNNEIPVQFLQLDSRLKRIFWIIWWGIFVGTLYFAERNIFKRKRNISSQAILQGKEPYCKIEYAYGKLKHVKNRKRTRELDSIIYKLKLLEEQLYIESDFGYGSSEVIRCENKISEYLEQLVNTVEKLNANIFREYLVTIDKLITEIQIELKVRQELLMK